MNMRAAIVAPLWALLLGGALPYHAQAATASQDAPPGFREIFVLAVIPTEDGNTVILADEPQEQFLPLGVGLTEALSIHIRLERQRFARPLTHDVLDDVMQELGAKVVRVQIDDFREDTFLGTIYVEERGGRVHRIDARPSDAIAVALGNRVPIFIKTSVLQEMGIHIDEILEENPDLEKPQQKAATKSADGPLMQL